MCELKIPRAGLAWCGLLVIGAALVLAHPLGAAEPLKPEKHKLMDLEGWSVHVDERLTDGPDAELGKRALTLLRGQLYRIALIMPEDRLKKVREVPIWLDRTHGKLTPSQYHPNPGWLKENGYTAELAKCVHIPDAAYFANPRFQHQQPWAVLHELAHAYHDRVLGFDEPKIKALWEKRVADGRYNSVLHIDGKLQRHYALTNHKEFFAEMSEAYFGMNDFYPFNRAELKRDDPEVFDLLREIWGPLP